MGSGKSTAADHIVKKYGFTRMRLSGKMREIGIELGLEITRDFLQSCGKFFREFDDDIWVRYLVREIQKTSASIVIDDIRRMNEVVYLKPLGFKFIRIQSSSEKRRTRIEVRGKKRISNLDWKRWSDHLTETQVLQLPVDYIIENDGSLEELRIKIDAVMEKVLGQDN